jgi:hypothetical protein
LKKDEVVADDIETKQQLAATTLNNKGKPE